MIGKALSEVIAADRDGVAGSGLALLQAAIRLDDPSCAEIADAMIAALGVRPDEPAVRALQTVAAAADRSGRDKAFHNPAHSREVAVNWWLLYRLHAADRPALSHAAVTLGLIAAFGHDIGHDGRGNDDVAFRLEAIACDLVDGHLRVAGVPIDDRRSVAAMILCTDVRHGYPWLDRSRSDDARFAPLDDPTVLLSARMLRDADLLPSAGTSPLAYAARTAELEREGGLRAGTLRAAPFFDCVVGRRFLSPPAQVFHPMMQTILGLAMP